MVGVSVRRPTQTYVCISRHKMYMEFVRTVQVILTVLFGAIQ